MSRHADSARPAAGLELFPRLPAEVCQPLRDNYYLGTSGYQFDDWRGTVYPAHVNERGLLGYYLHMFRFNALELNYTFYSMPSARTLQVFAERTPAGFQIAVKAHQEITHATLQREPRGAFRSFSEALCPLREAGKLAAVLLQFPFRFRNTPENRAYLGTCREAFGDDPVAVEFRHASWIAPEVEPLLRGLDLAYCSADEPALEGLVPFHAAVTAPLGYARFHGRNREWFTAGEKRRYDYDYSDDELRALVQRVSGMAGGVRKLLLFFNNCYMGRAVKNALRFRELLHEC